MKLEKIQYGVVTLAVMLAFVVVVLGAYTRLTDAGLGCPDWPGCYGKLIVPSADVVQQTHQVSLDKTAAMTEMVHRYLASGVGLLIVILNGLAWWRRHTEEALVPVALPGVLLLLVCGQGLLGMWTVTLKLHPVVVMAHLLGGFTILSGLWLHRLQFGNKFVTTLSASERRWQTLANVGLGLLVVQITLGGWVSSNYAGLACVGFPKCNQQWFPDTNFRAAFTLPNLGPNYEGGKLDGPARVSIQMTHRVVAVGVGLYLIGLACVLWRRARSVRIRRIAVAMLMITVLQFCLGIINVTQLLPLSVAVMHNGVAAILLLTLVSLVSASAANRGEWFHG